MLNNKVIYRHLKPCGEVFYIGIGNPNRAHTNLSRSKHWHSTVAKYGYEVQILKTGLTRSQASELEIILIAYYGGKDLGEGTLVNKTDGGDGVKRYICSDETKEKLRLAQTGRVMKPEFFNKMREVSSFREYNKIPRSESHLKAQSIAQTGKKQSAETIAKRVESSRLTKK